MSDTHKNDCDSGQVDRHSKMRDMVMTWDEILDALIWDAYDTSGPEHQPISASRLEEFCKRFPHFEERLRWTVSAWNVQENLTDEVLASIEVTDEQVDRSLSFAKWTMRFYSKLHHLEQELAAANERAEEYRLKNQNIYGRLCKAEQAIADAERRAEESARDAEIGRCVKKLVDGGPYDLTDSPKSFIENCRRFVSDAARSEEGKK